MHKLLFVRAVIFSCFFVQAWAPLASVIAPTSTAQQEVRSVPGSQSEDIPRGKLIEKVLCAKNTTQSYALYVPSSYTTARKWPVLYAFDPAARGALPVSRFQEAAEKYGWIVVGSNNSSNGSARDSLDAFAEMWDDTHQRFALDPRRAYATGFSGGARMAVMAAHLCGECVAGVIASGAGFYQGLVPSAKLRFIFFGAVGIDDFNFPELQSLDEALNKVGLSHRIEVFDGRHEWPPSAVATDALEWMEVQAIKAGTRERDDALLASLWEKKLAQGKAFEESKKFYEAYRTYSGMTETFRNLRDVSEVEKKSIQLRDRSEVNTALRDERQQIKKQEELSAQIEALISQRENGSERVEASNQLKQMLEDLQRSSKAVKDSGERRIARRLIAGFFVQHFEEGMNLLERQKKYRRAADSFELAIAVAPENSYARFQLACAYALAGEKRKSLQALKSAVEKGFSDPSIITGAKAFDSLRQEPEYVEIMQRLKQNR
jgi:predicted esterase